MAEGTTFCELQILANTAIYLKWQIRRSNLPESRRFFELFSFEGVCVRSRRRGESQGKRWLRDLNVQFHETGQSAIGIFTLFECWGDGWVAFNAHGFKPKLPRVWRHCELNPGRFYLLTFPTQYALHAPKNAQCIKYIKYPVHDWWAKLYTVKGQSTCVRTNPTFQCSPPYMSACVSVKCLCGAPSINQVGWGPAAERGSAVGHPTSHSLRGDPMSSVP